MDRQVYMSHKRRGFLNFSMGPFSLSSAEDSRAVGMKDPRGVRGRRSARLLSSSRATRMGVRRSRRGSRTTSSSSVRGIVRAGDANTCASVLSGRARCPAERCVYAVHLFCLSLFAYEVDLYSMLRSLKAMAAPPRSATRRTTTPRSSGLCVRISL